MSDTIKIEMDMPRPPEGWRHTGKFYSPKKGEFYQSPYENSARRAECDHINSPAPILERVPWEPKPGELVWLSSGYPGFQYRWDKSSCGYQYFKTQEDADKFYAESRALADRIRAESEARDEN